MNERRKIPVLLRIIAAIGLIAVVRSGGPIMADENDQLPSARVVDVEGIVRLLPSDSVVLRSRVLTEADTIFVEDRSSVTVVFEDGSVSRFTGPTVIAVAAARLSGGPLARLSDALRRILFAKADRRDETRLGVRGEIAFTDDVQRVPRLLYPPKGCVLRDPATELSWQMIDGVYAYDVQLYNVDSLLWQTSTNECIVKVPSPDSLLVGGQTYLWVVSARMGDEILRSEQALFSLLADSVEKEVAAYSAEIDRDVSDPRLRSLLKVEMFRSYGLTIDSFRECRLLLDGQPEDRTVLLLMAGALEDVGMMEEALALYKDLALKW